MDCGVDGCRMSSGGLWVESADVIVAVCPADDFLFGHCALRRASAECEELAALAVGRDGGDIFAEFDLIKGGEGHGWCWVAELSAPVLIQ